MLDLDLMQIYIYIRRTPEYMKLPLISASKSFWAMCLIFWLSYHIGNFNFLMKKGKGYISV